MERERINVYCILRDVIHNFWLAIIVGVSAAMLLYVCSSILYHPSYTSRTTFVVLAKDSSVGPYANITKVEKIMDIFEAIMESDVLKRIVSEEIGMESFAGSVNTSIVEGTNLLTVSVTSSKPETAIRLLKGILEHYPKVGEGVLGEVVLEIFEMPSYPETVQQLPA